MFPIPHCSLINVLPTRLPAYKQLATSHSLLVLKEVLRSLVVPYHSGPVVLQRLYVPGEIGLWV